MATRKQQAQAEAILLAEALGRDPDELLELVELGFETPDQDPHYRLIANSVALDKCGKTHFAILTTPEPVGLIDLDVGTEGLIDRPQYRKRKIVQKKFSTRREKLLAGEEYTQKDAEKDWADIQTALRALIRSKAIRTLVVDTATDLWEIARLAHFGKLTQVMPENYVTVNSEFSNLIRAPYSRSDINVVYIDKMKKEYKGKQWSGEYERVGFGDTPFAVQINLRHYRVPEKEDENRPFALEVVNCRQNSDLDGEELVGPMCNFMSLARMVFPESKKEDWV